MPSLREASVHRNLARCIAKLRRQPLQPVLLLLLAGRSMQLLPQYNYAAFYYRARPMEYASNTQAALGRGALLLTVVTDRACCRLVSSGRWHRWVWTLSMWHTMLKRSTGDHKHTHVLLLLLLWSHTAANSGGGEAITRCTRQLLHGTIVSPAHPLQRCDCSHWCK